MAFSLCHSLSLSLYLPTDLFSFSLPGEISFIFSSASTLIVPTLSHAHPPKQVAPPAMEARSCHHLSSPSRKRPRRPSATSQQRPRGSQPAMIQPQHQQGGHRLRRRPLPRHHRLPLQRLQQVYLPRLLLREVLFSPRAWPISPRGGTPRKGPWPSSRMCTGYDHELSPRDLRACLELLRTKTKKKSARCRAICAAH